MHFVICRVDAMLTHNFYFTNFVQISTKLVFLAVVAYVYTRLKNNWSNKVILNFFN